MLYDNHPLNPQSYPVVPDPYRYVRTTQFQKYEWTEEFEQFLKNLHANELKTYVRVPLPQTNTWDLDIKESNNPDNPKVFVMDTYKTGGTHGQNGGDYSVAFKVDTDALPTKKMLECVLEIFWPEVPSKTRQACQDVIVKRFEWNVNEYYGDSSDYCCEAVDLEKMFLILQHYNKLAPHKVVSEPNKLEGILRHSIPVVEQTESTEKSHVFKIK